MVWPTIRDELQLARYRGEVCEPTRLPSDHPFAWQWEFRGTKDEVERLRAEVEASYADEVAPPAEQGALW